MTLFWLNTLQFVISSIVCIDVIPFQSKFQHIMVKNELFHHYLNSFSLQASLFICDQFIGIYFSLRFTALYVFNISLLCNFLLQTEPRGLIWLSLI